MCFPQPTPHPHLPDGEFFMFAMNTVYHLHRRLEKEQHHRVDWTGRMFWDVGARHDFLVSMVQLAVFFVDRRTADGFGAAVYGAIFTA
jgi:hypothetical protein